MSNPILSDEPVPPARPPPQPPPGIYESESEDYSDEEDADYVTDDDDADAHGNNSHNHNHSNPNNTNHPHNSSKSNNIIKHPNPNGTTSATATTQQSLRTNTPPNAFRALVVIILILSFALYLSFPSPFQLIPCSDITQINSNPYHYNLPIFSNEQHNVIYPSLIKNPLDYWKKMNNELFASFFLIPNSFIRIYPIYFHNTYRFIQRIIPFNIGLYPLDLIHPPSPPEQLVLDNNNFEKVFSAIFSTKFEITPKNDNFSENVQKNDDNFFSQEASTTTTIISPFFRNVMGETFEGKEYDIGETGHMIIANRDELLTQAILLNQKRFQANFSPQEDKNFEKENKNNQNNNEKIKNIDQNDQSSFSSSSSTDQLHGPLSLPSPVLTHTISLDCSTSFSLYQDLLRFLNSLSIYPPFSTNLEDLYILFYQQLSTIVEQSSNYKSNHNDDDNDDKNHFLQKKNIKFIIILKNLNLQIFFTLRDIHSNDYIYKLSLLSHSITGSPRTPSTIDTQKDAMLTENNKKKNENKKIKSVQIVLSEQKALAIDTVDALINAPQLLPSAIIDQYINFVLFPQDLELYSYIQDVIEQCEEEDEKNFEEKNFEKKNIEEKNFDEQKNSPISCHAYRSFIISPKLYGMGRKSRRNVGQDGQNGQNGQNGQSDQNPSQNSQSDQNPSQNSRIIHQKKSQNQRKTTLLSLQQHNLGLNMISILSRLPHTIASPIYIQAAIDHIQDPQFINSASLLEDTILTSKQTKQNSSSEKFSKEKIGEKKEGKQSSSFLKKSTILPFLTIYNHINQWIDNQFQLSNHNTIDTSEDIHQVAKLMGIASKLALFIETQSDSEVIIYLLQSPYYSNNIENLIDDLFSILEQQQIRYSASNNQKNEKVIFHDALIDLCFFIYTTSIYPTIQYETSPNIIKQYTYNALLSLQLLGDLTTKKQSSPSISNTLSHLQMIINLIATTSHIHGFIPFSSNSNICSLGLYSSTLTPLKNDFFKNKNDFYFYNLSKLCPNEFELLQSSSFLSTFQYYIKKYQNSSFQGGGNSTTGSTTSGATDATDATDTTPIGGGIFHFKFSKKPSFSMNFCQNDLECIITQFPFIFNVFSGSNPRITTDHQPTNISALVRFWKRLIFNQIPIEQNDIVKLHTTFHSFFSPYKILNKKNSQKEKNPFEENSEEKQSPEINSQKNYITYAPLSLPFTPILSEIISLSLLTSSYLPFSTTKGSLPFALLNGLTTDLNSLYIEPLAMEYGFISSQDLLQKISSNHDSGSSIPLGVKRPVNVLYQHQYGNNNNNNKKKDENFTNKKDVDGQNNENFENFINEKHDIFYKNRQLLDQYLGQPGLFTTLKQLTPEVLGQHNTLASVVKEYHIIDPLKSTKKSEIKNKNDNFNAKMDYIISTLQSDALQIISTFSSIPGLISRYQSIPLSVSYRNFYGEIQNFLNPFVNNPTPSSVYVLGLSHLGEIIQFSRNDWMMMMDEDDDNNENNNNDNNNLKKNLVIKNSNSEKMKPLTLSSGYHMQQSLSKHHLYFLQDQRNSIEQTLGSYLSSWFAFLPHGADFDPLLLRQKNFKNSKNNEKTEEAKNFKNNKNSSKNDENIDDNDNNSDDNFSTIYSLLKNTDIFPTTPSIKVSKPILSFFTVINNIDHFYENIIKILPLEDTLTTTPSSDSSHSSHSSYSSHLPVDIEDGELIENESPSQDSSSLQEETRKSSQHKPSPKDIFLDYLLSHYNTPSFMSSSPTDSSSQSSTDSSSQSSQSSSQSIRQTPSFITILTAGLEHLKAIHSFMSKTHLNLIRLDHILSSSNSKNIPLSLFNQYTIEFKRLQDINSQLGLYSSNLTLFLTQIQIDLLFLLAPYQQFHLPFNIITPEQQRPFYSHPELNIIYKKRLSFEELLSKDNKENHDNFFSKKNIPILTLPIIHQYLYTISSFISHKGMISTNPDFYQIMQKMAIKCLYRSRLPGHFIQSNPSILQFFRENDPQSLQLFIILHDYLGQSLPQTIPLPQINNNKPQGINLYPKIPNFSSTSLSFYYQHHLGTSADTFRVVHNFVTTSNSQSIYLCYLYNTMVSNMLHFGQNNEKTEFHRYIDQTVDCWNRHLEQPHPNTQIGLHFQPFNSIQRLLFQFNYPGAIIKNIFHTIFDPLLSTSWSPITIPIRSINKQLISTNGLVGTSYIQHPLLKPSSYLSYLSIFIFNFLSFSSSNSSFINLSSSYQIEPIIDYTQIHPIDLSRISPTLLTTSTTLIKQFESWLEYEGLVLLANIHPLDKQQINQYGSQQQQKQNSNGQNNNNNNNNNKNNNNNGQQQSQYYNPNNPSNRYGQSNTGTSGGGYGTGSLNTIFFRSPQHKIDTSLTLQQFIQNKSDAYGNNNCNIDRLIAMNMLFSILPSSSGLSPKIPAMDGGSNPGIGGLAGKVIKIVKNKQNDRKSDDGQNGQKNISTRGSNSFPSPSLTIYDHSIFTLSYPINQAMECLFGYNMDIIDYSDEDDDDDDDDHDDDDGDSDGDHKNDQYTKTGEDGGKENDDTLIVTSLSPRQQWVNLSSDMTQLITRQYYHQQQHYNNLHHGNIPNKQSPQHQQPQQQQHQKVTSATSLNQPQHYNQQRQRKDDL